ncbi:MAG TPA: signal peptidase II [Chloroflexota bacterium]|nr:signal peptidase II [Chloroflexota bacterium]
MSEIAVPAEQRRGRARELPLRGLLFLGLAALVVVVDQVSKRLAEERLERTGVRSVPVPVPGVSDYLRLTYTENRGAAFGVLQDQTTFFVLVGLVVVGVIAASYRYLPRSGFRIHLALGLQLGGAVGNLIDRIRQGYVVDFVDFGYKSNWWPVFNVADSAIVIGVALLALNALTPTEPSSAAPTENA